MKIFNTLEKLIDKIVEHPLYEWILFPLITIGLIISKLLGANLTWEESLIPMIIMTGVWVTLAAVIFGILIFVIIVHFGIGLFKILS